MPRRFSWIIDGKLAGMERPGSICRLEKDLEFLKEAEIEVIVNLEEYAHEYDGFQVKHIPIGDFKAPKLADIEEFVKFIVESIESGKRILVHCFAGMGRTNVMLASYLVHLGMNPDDALETVRGRRLYHAVNEKQVEALREYHYTLRY